jgi:hypothetical protein
MGLISNEAVSSVNLKTTKNEIYFGAYVLRFLENATVK